MKYLSIKVLTEYFLDKNPPAKMFHSFKWRHTEETYAGCGECSQVLLVTKCFIPHCHLQMGMFLPKAACSHRSTEHLVWECGQPGLKGKGIKGKKLLQCSSARLTVHD